MNPFRAVKGRLKEWLFRSAPTRLYLALYARDTDRRVVESPSRASGHPEGAVAPLVMAYVRHLGLEPHHHLLDFGCGTLRTGKHLIAYLEPGRYMGVDISRGAVDYALDLVARDASLSRKAPRVEFVEPFQELDLPRPPDFVLCHSVFTHLVRTAARRTFRQLRHVMGEGTTLALTAFCGESYGHRSYKNIQYPASEIVEMARRNGIVLHELDGDWGMSHTIFHGSLADSGQAAGGDAG
jgi:SAM-dependent methyltransferase